MLSVIAGPDDRDTRSLRRGGLRSVAVLKGDLKGLRIAYSADWGYAAVDERVRKIVGGAVAVFERDLGCVVEEADPGWENPYEGFWGMVVRESDLRGMRSIAKQLGKKMTPHLRALLETDWTAEQLTDATATRNAVSNAMWRFMRKYDLFLTPTLAVPPFEVGIQGARAHVSNRRNCGGSAGLRWLGSKPAEAPVQNRCFSGPHGTAYASRRGGRYRLATLQT